MGAKAGGKIKLGGKAKVGGKLRLKIKLGGKAKAGGKLKLKNKELWTAWYRKRSQIKWTRKFNYSEKCAKNNTVKLIMETFIFEREGMVMWGQNKAYFKLTKALVLALGN